MKAKRKRKDKAFIGQVAYNIRQYRTELCLTQLQLQEMSGLKIYRYESGKHDLTLTTLNIISKHLNIEPWKLLIF